MYIHNQNCNSKVGSGLKTHKKLEHIKDCLECDVQVEGRAYLYTCETFIKHRTSLGFPGKLAICRTTIKESL